ncbi:phospholipase D family protein [Rahnella sikkimica]|uniref:phospholipase D n=1 Tax=Rahnella sikkimica TaxID=1805933 RepID=A0A2L1UZH9_9GAMM|nr:phospholipase D family protein [Rahnella sikkimica]AVF38281.1 phospholipase D family protein [Rahnella sikkimica]
MKKYLPAVVLVSAFLLPMGTALAAPSIDVGFSPEGSALQLVMRTIENAQQSIRLMGYSFTSPEVARGLVEAKRRGVDVKVVVDEKGNKGKASVAAMNLLVNAAIPVRTISKYKISHDKVIIVDGQTVETGSFNFTRSAAEANSENALVISGLPALAQTYITHWQSRWDDGTDWHSTY